MRRARAASRTATITLDEKTWLSICSTLDAVNTPTGDHLAAMLNGRLRDALRQPINELEASRIAANQWFKRAMKQKDCARCGAEFFGENFEKSEPREAPSGEIICEQCVEDYEEMM